jgi:nitrogen regulatory protein P-II 1
MKKLEAIIRPVKLGDVKDALAKEGVEAMTISGMKGSASGEARAELYRGAEYVVDFLPKVKIEVVLSDDLAERAAEIIRLRAHTGLPGDGNTLLLPVDEAIRIRTGQRGEEAV